jgi:rhodanese-related sulfurtransferase
VGRYRIESGRKAYSEAGHIPGAALIELQEDLSDQTSGLRFTALAPADLVSAFKAKGVGDDSDVVLYAGGDQVWATRVWWLLRTIGFDRAAVLDGGFKKWRVEGRPLSTVTTTYPAAATLTLNERRGLLTDKDGVLQALENPTAVVVNCLDEERHKGTSPYHYGRPAISPARSTCRLPHCWRLTVLSSQPPSFGGYSPPGGSSLAAAARWSPIAAVASQRPPTRSCSQPSSATSMSQSTTTRCRNGRAIQACQ